MYCSFELGLGSLAVLHMEVYALIPMHLKLSYSLSQRTPKSPISKQKQYQPILEIRNPWPTSILGGAGLYLSKGLHLLFLSNVPWTPTSIYYGHQSTSQVSTRILSTPSTVHMLLPRIQFPHDGNLYPAWLLLAWKLLSFYHVEIAFQDASPGLGLQHAWCLLHHGEFLIMQSCYKIICQMTVHTSYLNFIAQ